MSDDKLKRLRNKIQGTKPVGLPVRHSTTVKVTVEEIEAAMAKASPGCPIAAAMAEAIGAFPPTYSLFVEKVDLEAMMSGKSVEHTEEISGGVLLRKKTLPTQGTPKKRAEG